MFHHLEYSSVVLSPTLKMDVRMKSVTHLNTGIKIRVKKSGTAADDDVTCN